DDSLTEEEINLITGTYEIPTGIEEQVQLVSWWPRPSTWQDSGLNTGFWSHDTEEWYQTWLKMI
ncbi:hypothetical protein GYMLUDRAFT_110556, partial [Collybiopsis luxurians FD-317 M1]